MTGYITFKCIFVIMIKTSQVTLRIVVAAIPEPQTQVLNSFCLHCHNCGLKTLMCLFLINTYHPATNKRPVYVWIIKTFQVTRRVCHVYPCSLLIYCKTHSLKTDKFHLFESNIFYINVIVNIEAPR